MKVDRFAKELTECFKDISFNDITPDSLRTLDGWLIAQGNAANTTHKKFGFLRMFFEQAIQEGKAAGINPFKLYKIKPVRVKLSRCGIQYNFFTRLIFVFSVVLLLWFIH